MFSDMKASDGSGVVSDDIGRCEVQEEKSEGKKESDKAEENLVRFAGSASLFYLGKFADVGAGFHRYQRVVQRCL